MGTEIVKQENGNGSTTPFLEFSDEQRQLIRDTYANGATDSEFAVLLEVAKARRLNPFTRQIHFVKRKDRERNREVWSAQASIDGLRAIAQRTGLYDGQDEPEYEYDDKGKLKYAKVSVYRKDWRRPAVGIAHFEEYRQDKGDGTPNFFWRTKPHIMLAKCAEALALRKAFPEDMGGLYCPEELDDSRPQLPSISPHGELTEGVAYLDDADDVIRAIESADSLDELTKAWVGDMDLYEKYRPEDKKKIGSAFRRRERQLKKPGRELDQQAAAAQSEDL